MDERDRWWLGIATLLAASLLLFLLVVLLNAGTILVGGFLSVFSFTISVLGVVLAIGSVVWLAGWILSSVKDGENRIRDELEALRMTLLRATNKLGADFLSFVSSALALVIQEAVADYPRLYRISIALLFGVVFFLASQLIGSDRMSERIIGVFFFAAPVITFFAAVLIFVPGPQISRWISERSPGDVFLLTSLLLSVLLTFAFAFLKNREV